MQNRIPFNKPYLTGFELSYVEEAYRLGQLAGDGQFTKTCEEKLESLVGCNKALLTHSCTAAMEMMALLLDIRPGDEVIMPSFTFVSTANAFVLRGAVPVFVDIREDTKNIDEGLVESAITERTKAIIIVHYAGIGCDMDLLIEIATRRGVVLLEDAAQAICASYNGRPLGSWGVMAALSFHETKNVISGEGGALLINDTAYIAQAEIIREKGTNRSGFFRGEVDRYTWVGVGSSYVPGEIVAAFLTAQLEHMEKITVMRHEIWDAYHEAFRELEEERILERPSVPLNCSHNGHTYYILLKNGEERGAMIEKLRMKGVHAVFHYVPLHSSPAGARFGRAVGNMSVTKSVSERLLRLPLWIGVDSRRVIDAVYASCGYSSSEARV